MKASKKIVFGAIAAVAAAGAFVTTAPAASARVVCNRWHECWRVQDRYVYPAHFGIVVRSDSWAARHRNDRAFRWREERHERGYWRNNVWHRW